MADIRKINGLKGTTYQVRYPSKTTKSGYAYATFATLKEACAFREDSSARSAAKPRYAELTTVEQAVQRWLDVCEHEGRDGRDPVSPAMLAVYKGCASIMRAYSWEAQLHELGSADLVAFRSWLLNDYTRDQAKRAFLENALDGLSRQDDPATLPRCGVWECEAVETVVTLILLRIRHRIDSRGRLGPQFAMAEEAAAIGFDASTGGRVFAGDAAFALLEAKSGNVPDRVRDTQLAKAVAQLAALKPALNAYGAERAAALATDHSRVRQALGSRAGVRVEAIVPVDVIGLYVLMPRL
jgi:hypothetical protein